VSTPAEQAEPKAASPLSRALKLLRSVRFAIVLMALIAAACIVGTLVKQEPYDPAKAIAHYGRALGLLVGLLGLHQLYHTWWFIALLGLFALSTTVCALSRRRLRLHTVGSSVVHLSVLFIVAGAIVRGAVGVEGVVTITEGQTVEEFDTDQGKLPLGLRVRLDDFRVTRRADKAEVIVFLPGEERGRVYPAAVGKPVTIRPDGTTLEVLQYLPHFMMDGSRVYSASDEPVNPAIQVKLSGPGGESKRWLFARFPDVHSRGASENDPILRYQQPVRTFESHLTVLDPSGAELRRAVVLVNSPLRVGRYTLYQLSYDQQTEQSSTLEVVYDPGVPIVFIGFLLMPLGIAYVFYIQPILRRRTVGHV